MSMIGFENKYDASGSGMLSRSFPPSAIRGRATIGGTYGFFSFPVRCRRPESQVSLESSIELRARTYLPSCGPRFQAAAMRNPAPTWVSFHSRWRQPDLFWRRGELVRTADGFLTRESWEKDLRARRSQRAVEQAIADGSLVAPGCLEDVETAFKRSHRGRNRTEDAWRQELERWKTAKEEYFKAQNKISDQAHSQPITEEDWQKELKRRERVRRYLEAVGEHDSEHQ